MRPHAQGISSAGHARDRGSRRGRHVHRRRPDRRGEAGDGQGARPPWPTTRAGVIEARAPGASRRGARRRRRGAPRPRHDGRHQRHARAPRCAHGVRGHARLRRRARARPPGPSAPVPAGAGAACAARRGHGRGRRADGARRRAAPAASRHPSRRRRGGCGASGSRRSPSACCTAYADPSHEQAVAAGLRAALPGVHVVASHEVAAEFREFERASTTIADAYLGPVAGRLSAPPGRDRGGRGPTGARGDAVQRGRVRRRRGGRPSGHGCSCPGRPVASPPLSRRAIPDAISFDMGGTSTDVCLIRGGVAGRSAERRVGGLPLRLPQLDIHTVGAGGGSIAWLDPGGALRVGPASAGADPGPACYGRGGVLPTVTDANLVLGRLDPDVPLAGGLRLDRGRCPRGAAGGGGPVRRRPQPQPKGSWRSPMPRWCARSAWSASSRATTPASSSWSPSGGGAAARLRRGGQPRACAPCVVPAASGVLSALGIAAGERRRVPCTSVMRPLAAFRRRAAPPAPRPPRRGDRSRSSASCATAARRTS